MSSFQSKLFGVSILNAATAGLNFLSNFIIVKLLSLEILGEQAVFLAYIAFGGLIFSLIPPNYSVFKLQDSTSFKSILIGFYILCSIIFFPFAVALKFLVFPEIGLTTIYFVGVTTFCLSFFDIKFQASGELKKFFMFLFIVAFIKIISLSGLAYFGYINDLSGLLWTLTTIQGVILIIFLVPEKDHFVKFIREPMELGKSSQFVLKNFSEFKPYYLNTALKRVRSNSLILLFSRTASSETMGLISLFLKVSTFVLGLSRTVESFFMNRQNLISHKNEFVKKVPLFAFSLQLIYITVGIIYLRVLTGNYYAIAFILQSFLVYPHIYFLFARAEMLSNYSNKEMNISEIIYALIVLTGYILGEAFVSHQLYLMLATFTIANFGLQAYMIFKLRKRNEYAHVN